MLLGHSDATTVLCRSTDVIDKQKAMGVTETTDSVADNIGTQAASIGNSQTWHWIQWTRSAGCAENGGPENAGTNNCYTRYKTYNSSSYRL